MILLLKLGLDFERKKSKINEMSIFEEWAVYFFENSLKFRNFIIKAKIKLFNSCATK